MIGVIYARYSAGPNQTDQSIEGQIVEPTLRHTTSRL